MPSNKAAFSYMNLGDAFERTVTGTALAPLWIPFPGPQAQAMESEADEILYGGAAGAGKTGLLIGKALTRHRKSVIFRREYKQLKEIVDQGRAIIAPSKSGIYVQGANEFRMIDGRVCELGAVQYEEDVQSWQGRPHDFVGFDELTQFTQGQYEFLTGWARTGVKGQRTKVVGATNPPTSAEGFWVIQHWAPWLDPQYYGVPALPGELRWFVRRKDGQFQEVPDGSPITLDDELLYPRSRTFIPGKLEDNPVLSATPEYRAVLQALPPVLRAIMLDGNWLAGMADDAWQLIPTEWIRAAQARWSPAVPVDMYGEELELTGLGVDVARGGRDQTVLARRHGHYFREPIVYPGAATPDGPLVAGQVLVAAAENVSGVSVFIDIVGWGASAYDFLVDAIPGQVFGVNGSNRSDFRDRSGRLLMMNARSEMWWLMRQSLDPVYGDGLMLPPDQRLLADLTAPRWKLRAGGVVQVEDKKEINRRLGRSPDVGDAYVMGNLDLPPTGHRVREVEVEPSVPARGWLGDEEPWRGAG